MAYYIKPDKTAGWKWTVIAILLVFLAIGVWIVKNQ